MVIRKQINGNVYLQYLLRFGLDKSVYNDFKKYGIISCSEHNCADDKIKEYHFIDYSGIEDEWIDKIVETEQTHEIKVYHILHSKGKLEFVCMYCNDYDYKDYKYCNDKAYKHEEEEDNFNDFTKGKAKCFRYLPETNEIKFGSIKYHVKLGGIVEK